MEAAETSSREHASQPRRFRALAAVLVGGLLLVVSSPASAFPEFPGIIVDELSDLGLTCTPTCSLCHTGSPNLDNAQQPLANDLLSFRSSSGGPITVPLEPENLPVYLEALRTQPCPPGMPGDPLCDADSDGVDDIAELLVDSDPNGPGALACPKYGCGARIAPQNSSRPLDGTAVLAALSAAVVLVRRWRRR